MYRTICRQDILSTDFIGSREKIDTEAKLFTLIPVEYEKKVSVLFQDLILKSDFPEMSSNSDYFEIFCTVRCIHLPFLDFAVAVPSLQALRLALWLNIVSPKGDLESLMPPRGLLATCHIQNVYVHYELQWKTLRMSSQFSGCLQSIVST